MSDRSLSDPAYRRDLGDGLVLRWATPADCERLAELYGYVFRKRADDPPNAYLQGWTRELFSGQHPLLQDGAVALVDDTTRDLIVAGTVLLDQEWDYAGIPFAVGRPEIVASHPEYRNRGLVRLVFDLIHARSADRGHLAQGITGIPYFYRQFGYEYALDLGGARRVPLSGAPGLKEGEAEPFTLRDAAADDMALIRRLYELERTRRLSNGVVTSALIPEGYWYYQISQSRAESGEGWRTQLIQGSDGRALGYVLTQRLRSDESLAVWGLSLEPGVAWPTVMPSLLRALTQQAATTPAKGHSVPPPRSINFLLGRSHPAYAILGDSRISKTEPPYAWYVRVPDLPLFLRHIAPVLERRLGVSAVAGHTGELRLDFYCGGLRLAFDGGRLVAAEEWRQSQSWGPRPQAGFPPLVFLQLLFGHRSLAELRASYPDVWADDEAAVLLETLFPAGLSWVLPLD